MHACRHRLGPDQRQPGPSPLSPAPRAPAMPRRRPCLAPPPAPLSLRFRALLGLGFVPPPEPRPCVHCASIAYALLPAARVPLCRHRADPESSSRSLPSGSPARIAPIAPTARRRPHRAHRAPTSASRPISLPALRRPQGPDWQESHRMHPFFAECTKKAPFLATSARNACFSRSEWQHPRPRHPFPGAIGRFRIHGARILPPRAFFRVEEPEITHGTKMLPAPSGLSAAAACGMAERALRHATAACDTQHGRTGFAPCGAGLACLPHARPLPSRLCPPPPAFIAAVLYASRFAARIAPTHAVIRHAAHCGRDEPPIGLFLPPSCCPRRRIAPIDARSPAPPGPDPRQPSPSPEPTGPQPRASRVPACPWSHLRPPAPRHPPRLTLPRGSRCGSGNSCEMVR